jgi:hypothetical protein
MATAAGVVDEHAQARGAVDQRVDVGRREHVGADEPCLLAADSGDGLRAPALVDVGDDDVRALRREALGDRPAGAHRRAGDDRCGAGEVHRGSDIGSRPDAERAGRADTLDDEREVAL